MSDPIPCIIESPLAGNLEINIRYARWCMRALLDQGYAPFASHLLYPQCYDDEDPKLREAGIKAGLAVSNVLAAAGATRFFCVDLGMSGGMKRAELCGGMIRSFRLEKENPAYWQAFLLGESPHSTRGAVD